MLMVEFNESYEANGCNIILYVMSQDQYDDLIG